MLEGHVIQRDNVYTLACQNGMTVSEASEFKRDHNLWSVLSRYMVLQRPSMLAAVSFRRTPVDSVDLWARGRPSWAQPFSPPPR